MTSDLSPTELAEAVAKRMQPDPSDGDWWWRCGPGNPWHAEEIGWTEAGLLLDEIKRRGWSYKIIGNENEYWADALPRRGPAVLITASGPDAPTAIARASIYLPNPDRFGYDRGSDRRRP